MLKVHNLALIGFGIDMVELYKNRHKLLNKVKCQLAWTDYVTGLNIHLFYIPACIPTPNCIIFICFLSITILKK